MSNKSLNTIDSSNDIIDSSIPTPSIIGPSILGPSIIGPSIPTPSIIGPSIIGPSIIGPSIPSSTPGPGPSILSFYGPPSSIIIPNTTALVDNKYNQNILLKGMKNELQLRCGYKDDEYNNCIDNKDINKLKREDSSGEVKILEDKEGKEDKRDKKTKEVKDNNYMKCTRCSLYIYLYDYNSHISSHSSLILSFLYLGGERNSKNLIELQLRTNITHIINMSWESANAYPDLFIYKNYMLSDYSYENIMNVFDNAADYIQSIKLKHGKVLIHCVQGISRSASIVCAYLIKYEFMTFENALKHVQKCRSIALPNQGFQKQLLMYEHALRSSTSVNINVIDSTIHININCKEINDFINDKNTELSEHLESVKKVTLETQFEIDKKRLFNQWYDREPLIRLKIALDNNDIFITTIDIIEPLKSNAICV